MDFIYGYENNRVEGKRQITQSVFVEAAIVCDRTDLAGKRTEEVAHYAKSQRMINLHILCKSNFPNMWIITNARATLSTI
jgi:hypothetical protein